MKSNLLVLLLFTVIGLSAQPRIVFDKVQHDFGRVNEDGGTVSHNFTFTNTGTAPLIINNVVTTCGCTTPEYSRQPVRPGDKGFITVGYDVKGRPGAIDRTIAVHTNTTPPTTNLRIVGSVVAVDRHPSEAFRHQMGALRLSDRHISFNKMFTYEKPTLQITAFNPGPDPVRISFANLPAHITAEARPASIRSGERASIIVTYDAARKRDWGFVSDQIGLILNDNRSDEHRLTVTATIEEDFSRWTATQMQNAPIISLDRHVIEAGRVRKGEQKSFQVRLTNNGRGALAIRKVDTGAGGLLTVNAPSDINAGASANMTVTLNSGAGQNGELNRTITLITNDPRNSQITLRLRAELTD